MFSDLRKFYEKVRLVGGIFQLANTGENVFGFRIFLRKIQTRGKHFSAANTGENVFRTCENLRKKSENVPSFTAAAKTHRGGLEADQRRAGEICISLRENVAFGNSDCENIGDGGKPRVGR